jgi:hypothetical protein
MKDRWDHFEEKFAKIMLFALADCLGQIRIRYDPDSDPTSQNFQDQTGPKYTKLDQGAMKLSASRSLTLFKNAFVLCLGTHVCLTMSGCIVRIEVKRFLLTRIQMNAMQLVSWYGSRSSAFGQCRSGSKNW